MRNYFEMALKNISKYGDTDIFPFPIEQYIFFDDIENVVNLLLDADKEFFDNKDGNEIEIKSFLSRHPPVNASALAPIGYTGFRWATQLDPFWNAYFLGIVLSIAEKIEKERIPKELKKVFSYRFRYDNENHTLFDSGIGWNQFMERSTELCSEYDYMLICDISDFYPRVYHHRLENAMLHITPGTDIPKKIDKLLGTFSNNKSYSLPIGGPASRILAELVLNSTDRLLQMEDIPFCRFVDDYHLFAKSEEEAYHHLVFLSEKLLLNDGLSLQKSKTRLMQTSEFLQTSQGNFGHETVGQDELELREFLRLRIHYDPYGENPAEDYERTKNEIERFDILGMLKGELEKSRIHSAATKQLLRATSYLSDEVIDDVATILIDSFKVLSPIFPQVMIVFLKITPKLSDLVKEKLWEGLRRLMSGESHILQIDLNLMYAVRVFGTVKTVENEITLSTLYKNNPANTLLRKDIILIMAKWGNYHWLSDRIKSFSTLDAWERRACIIASYSLKDEGKHWRMHRKKEFSPFENITRDWASRKVNIENWVVPI